MARASCRAHRSGCFRSRCSPPGQSPDSDPAGNPIRLKHGLRETTEPARTDSARGGTKFSTYAFQSALADADKAWRNWLASLSGRRAGRRIGYPRFKKKGRSRDSVRLHHDVKHPTIRLDGYRRLMVPRIGSIRLHESGKRLRRYLTRTVGQIQSATLSRSGKHWYASVLVKIPALRLQVRAGLNVPPARSASTSASHAWRRSRPAMTPRTRTPATWQSPAVSSPGSTHPFPYTEGSNRRAKARARVAEATSPCRRATKWGPPPNHQAPRGPIRDHCRGGSQRRRNDAIRPRLGRRTWPERPAENGTQPIRSSTPASANSAASWPTRPPGTDPGLLSSLAFIPALRAARRAARRNPT